MVRVTGTPASACAGTQRTSLDASAMPARDLDGDDLDCLRELADGASRLLCEAGDLRSCTLLVAAGDGVLRPVGHHGGGVLRLDAPTCALAEQHRGRLRGHAPTELEGTPFVLIALLDGDAVVGVAVGRQRRRAPRLSALQRDALAAHGRLTSLAVTTQLTALRRQRAEGQRARIALARNLHDTVIQRLCGASMVLSAPGPLDARSRDRCTEELRLALAELRAALVATAERTPSDGGWLADDLAALRQTPGV
jgi:signal transduction histidine kinase